MPRKRNITVSSFTKKFEQQVIDLIVGIQSNEFAVAITAADQPDLQNIKHYYQQGAGNFWIALQDDEVLGTISFYDLGKQQVALRKMFVKHGYRGKPLNIGQKLLDTACDWAQEKLIKDIFLGTVPSYHAAHKFYEKNGFRRTEKSKLPTSFHIMEVDKYFFKKSLLPKSR